MKRLLTISLLIILISSCKKDIQETQPISITPSDVATEINGGPAWTSLPVPNGNPLNAPSGNNLIVPVNGEVFCFLGTPVSTTYKFNTSTIRWQSFSTVDLTAPYNKYLFSYGSKIYWGLFDFGANSLNNFFSVDITTGVRTVLTAFPGTHVGSPITFVIGNKGYLIGGVTPQGDVSDQFWEYDFTINLWSNKGNSPLGGRAAGTAVVIGSTVYMGLGFDRVYFNGTRITLYKDDWIHYTPGSSYSGIMTPFPGANRSSARQFIIDGLPYVGFGGNSSTVFTDLWRYNITGNSWTLQTAWPGTVSGNIYSIGGFTFNNAAYVVKGGIAEFWSYGD